MKAGHTVILVNPNRLEFEIGGPFFRHFHGHYEKVLIAMTTDGITLWNNKKVHPMSDPIYIFKNTETDGAIYLEARPTW